MWRPQLDFITLHYAYILLCSILSLVIIYPYGNLAAIDAYFFGASASTESGLNTVDLKDLKTYQQLFIYVIPIITNLGFVNILVVAVRIYWFKKKLKAASPSHVRPDPEAVVFSLRQDGEGKAQRQDAEPKVTSIDRTINQEHVPAALNTEGKETSTTTYYIPPPRERDNGRSFVELDAHPGGVGEHLRRCSDGSLKVPGNTDPRHFASPTEGDEIRPVPTEQDDAVESGLKQRRAGADEDPSVMVARSLQNVAGSVLVLDGRVGTTSRRASNVSRLPRLGDLPALSKQVTIGRNSSFYNLTAADEKRLGGIEYRALKLLVKILLGYFFGLHLFGVVCLVPWIHRAPAKYTDVLAQAGQDKTWWAFYSSQTMVDNLGFTLTPDSMISFRDATWPMLVMTFLAFAGNTLYPVLLRLVIYTVYKLVPTGSSTREALRFLLDHPRRCYTLLFPSRPTWILFGIVFVLNLVDVVLIVVLDLDNPTVADLAPGPRVLAALFQAASSRHTGAATYNLADINPAVQFSLLVMMYISILPIAISIRASNTYEERALGIYETQEAPDESNATSYVAMHFRNQLSFDLWYIFLGTFCLCVAESKRIVDVGEPSFSVFTVFFEIVSAYGNVGLSLGHPTVMTSLSGQFTLFSKLVVCAMMIRGRHRGLPYSIDRAIMLPGERPHEGDERRLARTASRSTVGSHRGSKLKPV